MLQKRDLHDYCLAKAGASKDEPFGDNIYVYKVGGKMFALIPFGENDPETITLKCDPNLAIVLRQTYPAVTGAYHFNKTHWNGIALDGSVPNEEILEWVDHSYGLIVKSLPKSVRETLTKPNE
jgi:predicted DNA-binding protein (MmcQ/YjbR family)